MELKYIVYITVNLCNGKLYIGVHRTNPDVFDGYIGCGIYRQSDAVDKNSHFHKAVKKYGYNNFRRTTIKIFDDNELGKKEAYSLEEELVNETFLKSKNVYNIAKGGGSSFTKETKKVYMFDLNGNYLRSFKSVQEAALYLNKDNLYSSIKAIRNNCLGRTSNSFGYYWSYNKTFNYLKSKTRIALYTISGKFIRYFDNIVEAEALLKINDISQALFKQSTAGGFQWRYYYDDNSDIPTCNNTWTRYHKLPIIMYDSNNNFIKEYNSVKECVQENKNFVSAQINRVLKGIIKTHKGYIFKYKDEDIV